MSILRKIYCYFGKHQRSRGRARRLEDGWHSHCKHCQIEMWKEDGGAWYVQPDSETALDADGGKVRGPLKLRPQAHA